MHYSQCLPFKIHCADIKLNSKSSDIIRYFVRPKLKVIGHFVRRPCKTYFKACQVKFNGLVYGNPSINFLGDRQTNSQKPVKYITSCMAEDLNKNELAE